MSDMEPGVELRGLVQRLVGSLEALTALAVLLDARADSRDPAAAVRDQLDAVADALGVRGALDQVDADTARSLQGFVRTILAQSTDFLEAPDRAGGWEYDDPTMLQATGAISAIFAPVIHDVVAPRLAGLSGRLASEDATYLDVGVGVAALALAMAKVFPALHVTGIDIWEPALRVARAGIARTGLADRVVTRTQNVCDLDDDAAYDLIWVAAPFLPPGIVPDALDRCARALRPGGWLLFARFGGIDELSTALSDLRAVRAGGAAWSDDDALRLVSDAGLSDAQHIELGIGVPGRITAGRR